MHPVSQIIIRNGALFDSGRWCVVNPPDATLFSSLKHIDLAALHQYFNVFQQCTGHSEALVVDSRDIMASHHALNLTLSKGKHTHTFGAFLPGYSATGKSYNNFLIAMPKSKAQLRMLVDMCADGLGNDGAVYVVGENRSGIKSLKNLLKGFAEVVKIDSARHCTLMRLDFLESATRFAPNSYIRFQDYEIKGTSWPVASLPGVFSEGELDAGTQLLLTATDTPVTGNVLDFACGSGVIGTYLSACSPAITVDYSDVNALALYACAHTLDRNQQAASIVAYDGLYLKTAQSNQQYDVIITNPPFHTGLETDYDIVAAFIPAAVASLKKHGKLYLVANRFLPYAEQLQNAFSQVDVLAQNSKFSVYLSR